MARIFSWHIQDNSKECFSYLAQSDSTGKYNKGYMVLDNKKRAIWIKDRDIDWSGFQDLPKEVQKRVRHRECKYTFGTIGEYEDGFTKIAWQISPDGRFYYLDKYYGGITSDEKDIWLEGKIDMNCMFVEKLQIHIRED